MEQMIITPIAKSLNISEKQVVNTLDLLEQGNTVPFIARYRKEVTNGLDEEQIRVIQENYAYQKIRLNRQVRRQKKSWRRKSPKKTHLVRFWR